MKSPAIAAVCATMLAVIALPAGASPCRGNDWQPTYVHDLTNPADSGPYYVMPGGQFIQLTGDWTNQSGPGMCCLYGVRDRRGFTDCQSYTRVQCGCDEQSMVNDTCRRFLTARGFPGGGGGYVGGIPQSCTTTYGRFTFTGQSSGVLARYPDDSGRIFGNFANGGIDGYWVEGKSARRCNRAIDGSYYWGRFVGRMSGNGFAATWSYCGDPPDPNRRWNGSDCR